MFNLFKKKNPDYVDRSFISYATIDVGMKLRVHPGLRSHSRRPYDVVVTESTSTGFTTDLNGNKRAFSYLAPEWDSYHKHRFKIL